MKSLFFQSVMMCLFISLALAVSAEVYRSVDPTGRVVYSDKPLDDSAEVLQIDSKPTDKQAIANQLQARLDAKHAAAADAQLAAQDEASEAEKQALRKENCRRAKQALASVLSARRLYVPQDNGERRYLNDQETTERRTAAQKDVNEWCGLK